MNAMAERIESNLPPRERPLPEPTRWQKLAQRLGNVLFVMADIGIFILLWEWLQTKTPPLMNPDWLPPPSQIAGSFVGHVVNGDFLDHGAFSATNYVLGLGIAIALGIPLGLLLGSSPTLKGIGGPYLWVLYSTPIIALQPILIIIFGFGIAAKVFLISLMCIFPVVINTMAGVETVDQGLLRAGRVFGASRIQIFTKIITPFILPWILTGLRLAAVRGLFGLLISELYGSTKGLGFLIVRAAEVDDTPTSYATIAIVVAFSLTIVQLFNWLERRLTPWRRSINL